jgi:hypothetical protein
MYELRYLVRNNLDGSEKVLQYRTQFEVTDYSTTTIQGSFTKKREYTEWQDVQTVNETK